MLQLNRLKVIYQKEKTSQPLVELSQLLRVWVLQKFADSQIPGLEGEPWLQFLDQQTGTQVFTQGAGRLLLTAPYEREPQGNILELFTVVESWIKSTSKLTSKQSGDQ